MNKIEEKMPKERKLLASSIEPKQIMTEKGIPVIIHFKEKLKKGATIDISTIELLFYIT